jgi:tRNA (guanine37-N1)-methyltransferase
VTELILLCPRGERLRQSMLEEWARCSHVIVLCGRYEGIDQRIETARPWRRVSVGDYVLSGGEVPAMVIIEGVTRLVPGVLGHTESAACDSFTDWSGSGGFDHPHYTRPIEYRGATVPEVLLSGNHAEIEKWRAQQRRAKQESTPARPTSDGGACGPPAIE